MPEWILTDKGLVPKQEYLDKDKFKLKWPVYPVFGQRMRVDMLTQEEFMREYQGEFNPFKSEEEYKRTIKK